MYYDGGFDETYAFGFTSDNISDTSDEEELQASDEVYKEGKTQVKKDDEATESNENFDCYTVIDVSILQSMLDGFAVCNYCRNELHVFEYPRRSHSFGRAWTFQCVNDQCESRFIPPRLMTSKKGNFFT